MTARATGRSSIDRARRRPGGGHRAACRAGRSRRPGRTARGARGNAGPDHRLDGHLRRPARPATRARHRRPDPHQPPPRLQDEALLLRRGVPRGPAAGVRLPAHVGRQGHAGGAGHQVDQAVQDAPARAADAAVQRQDGQGQADVRPEGHRWVRDARPAGRRFARVVPGLGVRDQFDLRQRRHRALPEGLRRPGPGGRPARTQDRRPGAYGLQQRQAGQAAVVLRLPSRGPTRLVQGHSDARPGRRYPGDARAAVVARRRRLGQAGRRTPEPRRSDPGRGDRRALAARRRPHDPGSGQPLDRRVRRPLRPRPASRRDRLLRG